VHRFVAPLSLLFAVVACGDDPSSSSGGGGTAGSGASATTGGSGAGNVGTPCDGAESHSGEATYYDFADGSGNCSFPATPDDLMVGAMNHTDYADSAACGACVRIDGPSGSVDVRIVDRCPECAPGDVDLSPEAFTQIAELSAGRVDISWSYIACPTDGPVTFHFKEGSNQWWTAVQVRNHRHAVASFAYQDAGGAFVDVPRLEYNYFVEEQGMGPGPYTFRVIDVLGQTLEQSGIVFAEAQEVSGDAQFEACATP
jgi:expansin